jgi:hypothetical protein
MAIEMLGGSDADSEITADLKKILVQTRREIEAFAQLQDAICRPPSSRVFLRRFSW